MISEKFDDDLAIGKTETSIEINFAVLKFMNKVRRK
jgi:hypothetical protein